MARHTTVQTGTKTHHVTLERTEDDATVAACNELPGLIALGSTEQEALKNIRNTLSDEGEPRGRTRERASNKLE